MPIRVLSWSGGQGGKIDVGFDDKHFGVKEMREEITLMSEVHPTLPDEVPQGTVFTFAKESTGHLMARFKVGDTVYRDVAQSSLRRLWDTVDLIEQLLHPERYKIVS